MLMINHHCGTSLFTWCVCVLQLAKNVGNAGFNEIMEACLTAEDMVKPNPNSDM